MTKKTATISTANKQWLSTLNHLVGTGRDKTTFRENVVYTVPMRDPTVTFFHASPTYYADQLMNAQSFLHGFANIPQQLRNVIDCLAKDPLHSNASVYIPNSPYASVAFELVNGRLQCSAKLCAVDIWNDVSRRCTELAVLSAYVCLGIRKRRMKCRLGDVQLEIGQAYLGIEHHNHAVSTLWASDLSSDHMRRFPQSPIDMNFLMEGALDGNPVYLIDTIDSYKAILHG